MLKENWLTLVKGQNCVIRFRHMSNTLSVRLPADLAAWLKDTARRSGQTRGEIVRAQLEKVRSSGGDKPWMALAGKAKGLPKDLSMREGFSRR